MLYHVIVGNELFMANEISLIQMQSIGADAVSYRSFSFANSISLTL